MPFSIFVVLLLSTVLAGPAGAEDSAPLPRLDGGAFLAEADSLSFDAFRQLSPDQQEEVRERFQQYRGLEPDEQRRIQRNARRFRDLPPEKQEELREAWQELKQLPEDEREALVDRLLSDAGY